MAGLGGAAAAAVFVAVAPPPAVASPDTLTIWRLATEWTEPRGPHGKTRLRSRASRAAAVNRFTSSEAEALDLNLHLCSWAPAEPVVVCRSTWEAIWARHARRWTNPWNGRSVELVDRRWVEADAGPGVWDALRSTCPVSSEALNQAGATSATTTASGPAVPAGAVSGNVGAATAGTGPGPGRGAPLALTGTDLVRTATLGAALAAAGTALVDRRRRVAGETDGGGADDG